MRDDVFCYQGSSPRSVRLSRGFHVLCWACACACRSGVGVGVDVGSGGSCWEQISRVDSIDHGWCWYDIFVFVVIVVVAVLVVGLNVNAAGFLLRMLRRRWAWRCGCDGFQKETAFHAAQAPGEAVLPLEVSLDHSKHLFQGRRRTDRHLADLFHPKGGRFSENSVLLLGWLLMRMRMLMPSLFLMVVLVFVEARL